MPSTLSFATSGAIIFSQIESLDRMLWPGIDAIEIGSLASERDLGLVLEAVRARGLRWGVHAPLWRSGLRREQFGATGLAESSRRQLDADFSVAADRGADYVLLHFPAFADRSPAPADARSAVERSLQDLRLLRRRHGVEVVLELKLGTDRDPGVISYVLGGALPMLASGEFPLCLDAGDWLMATEALHADPLQAFEPLAPVTRVIHVHGVERDLDPYLWSPIHPTHRDAQAVAAICRAALLRSPAVRVVFEHTPHVDPGLAHDLEGYRWLRSALEEAAAAP